MPANDDLIPISDFMLSSERNLEIATAIFEQYEAARDKVMTGFFNALEDELKAELPGWKFRRAPFFIERWGHFDVYKPDWKDIYAVRIEAWDHGKKIIYGISRNRTAAKAPLNAELLQAIRALEPRATSRDAFEAEILMQNPAKDWRYPSTLWRIKTDDAFRKEVKVLLLQVAKIAEPHVTRLIKDRK